MTQLDANIEEVKTVEPQSGWMLRPVHRCLRIVCRHYGLTMSELRARRRYRDLVQARQIAGWLASKNCASFPRIGRLLGGYDHTTIIHGCRQVEKQRQINPEFRALTDRLLAEAAEPFLAQLETAQEPEPLTDEQALLVARLPEPDTSWYARSGNDGREYLKQQNERFAAAMRAAQEEERRAGR